MSADAPAAHRGDVRAYVGLSGWNYPSWRNGFYKGVPQRRWLAHCARHFTSVEVNATFYRLLKESAYARWCEETPADFVFAIKGHRFATHVRRLTEPEEPVRRQRENVAALAPKLRVVLWQMPASLTRDMARLEAFAAVLDAWAEVRHALEFRHDSWFNDEVAECLARRRLAVCLSDAANWPLWDRVTTDLVYVRLHGHERTYASSYDDKSLDSWAERIVGWLAERRWVYVYFDNDSEGAAPYDALRLMARLGASTMRSDDPL